MRIKGSLALPLVVCSIILMLAACDLGNVLLSDSELESMYSIQCAQADTPVLDGSALELSLPIAIKLGRASQAPDAQALELVLLASDGSEAATLVFGTGKAARADAVFVPVDSLYTGLPPVLLPKDLAAGYYTLLLTVRRDDGSRLAGTRRLILIGAGQVPKLRVLAFPASQSAGQAALFKLAYQAEPGADPWVRWSVDGLVLSFGPVSARADRLLWKAPAEAGVHLISADYFPFQPPAESDIPAFARAEFKVPVTDAAAVQSMGFSLLDTASMFANGTVSAFGRPYPEALGASYGVALEEDSTLKLPLASMPDLASGSMFVAVELAPLPSMGDTPSFGSGLYLSLLAADGRTIANLGMEDGIPYLEANGETAYASDAAPAKAGMLAVSLKARPETLEIVWHAGDVFLGTATIPWTDAQAQPAVAQLGGLAAVYGRIGTGLSAYPAWRVSMHRRYGDKLLAADGFENAELAPAFGAVGSYRLADGMAYLDPGSFLSVGPLPLGATSGLEIMWTAQRGSLKLSLVLANGKRLVVSDSGFVAIDGTRAASLSITPGLPVQLQWLDGQLRLQSGTSSVEIPCPVYAGGSAIVFAADGSDRLVLDSLAVALKDSSR